MFKKKPQRSNEWLALNRQIRAIENVLGMDADDHAAFVKAHTKKSSLGACNVKQLRVVLSELRKLQPKNHKASGVSRSTKPYVRKIWALWGQLRDDGKLQGDFRAGLRAFVKRMCNVDDPEFLTSAQAETVIEALKAWDKRT
ncbi:MAG: regulatory protein GemA [Pseudomonadota bacterium]